MNADQIKPDHYRTDPSGVECIEITRHRNFNVGNAFKYLWRAGIKTEEGKTSVEKQIEDLEKAAWYLRDEIQRLQNQPQHVPAGEPIGQSGHTGKTGPTWCDLRPSIYEALQGTVAKGYKSPTASGEETPDMATMPAKGIGLWVSDREWPLGRPLNTEKLSWLTKAINGQLPKQHPPKSDKNA